ncbi:Uncharacterised protein [Zhongshania aliphaticivorans]|uniref:DUF924 domain-containing protein n=1 Tax=Zhongshania aliphaticivorans TaxID=1470434 RepID=A0A5S9MSW9_9GAMM|nr:DUF924 family protein [Zhongshania aliphaticivorans]CAA0079750.1 Uncharacterised protein [Zhongshania aliphaticivorans]CAA0086042.1 Uncharacterised protein [Zhongshania aliphaticivorans]
MHYRSVIEFWFAELSSSDWFACSDELDSKIIRRFGDIHRAAVAGELYSWRHQALGRLAEIIVLDQFSRNIFRGTSGAFAADGQALILAQEAIRAQADVELNKKQRLFLYMPYMHSESVAIQNASLRLFETLGLEDNYRFAVAHQQIISRFGRYPHRNAILGRPSSSEEVAFLKEAGSAF